MTPRVGALSPAPRLRLYACHVDGSSTAVSWLLGGAVVQRGEMAVDVALVEVRLPGASWLVLASSRRGAVGVGLLEPAARARARALLTTPRRRLAPARVVGLCSTGVWLEREGGIRAIVARAHPASPLEETEDAPPSELARWTDATEWLLRGARLLDVLEGSQLEDSRRALVSFIDREMSRMRKRETAVTADIQRGRTAQAAAEAARPFVAAAARAPRGTTKLGATDWSTGTARTCELALDPSKRPRDQVEAIFANARRMKRGAAIATSRLAEAEATRSRLGALRDRIVAATTSDELAAARDDAVRLVPSRSRTLADPTEARTASRKAPAARMPYRTFRSAAGARVLVGRGAADNDALTLHVARTHDLWLHAKGQPGAHVVVPLERGHDAPAELLVDAAHLAAHFSGARGEAVVEVGYAPRRFVRKPRGSPAGLVTVDREKTLVLRVDPARLALLLGREEGP